MSLSFRILPVHSNAAGGTRKFHAAAATMTTTKSTTTTRLYYFSYPDDTWSADYGGKKKSPVERQELQDLERARAAFEAQLDEDEQHHQHHQYAMHHPKGLVGHHAAGSTSSSSSNSIQKKAKQEKGENHLLTNAGRRLRELEMELLASLADSDAGIEELIHLWTTERDEEASTYLLAMQSAASECSAGLVQEEAALRQMSERYPAWAEPYSRLATLLYYKGEAREAIEMAEKAVDLKPWHFEALHIAVLLSQQIQENDDDDNDDSAAAASTTTIHPKRAQRLARKALPDLTDRRGRQVWVERAVAQAAQQLREAEQRTRYAQRSRQCVFREEDIWQ